MKFKDINDLIFSCLLKQCNALAALLEDRKDRFAVSWPRQLGN